MTHRSEKTTKMFYYDPTGAFLNLQRPITGYWQCNLIFQSYIQYIPCIFCLKTKNYEKEFDQMMQG